MKKLICLLLLFVMTFSFAIAENIDLSSMSIEELNELKNRIEKELSQRANTNGIIYLAPECILYRYSEEGTIILNGYEFLNSDEKCFLVLYCTYKNTTSMPERYRVRYIHAYQNGIELKDDQTADLLIPRDIKNQYTLSVGGYTPTVRAGYSYDFQRIYILTDFSPIDIECEKIFDYITTNVYTIDVN